MKRLILLALLLVGAYQYFTAPATSIETPPARANKVGGEQLTKHEFMELFDSGAAFSDLAESGHYTVIETYLDNCGVCRELESGFGAFTRARPDVRLVRVRMPQGGMYFEAKTSEELKSIQARLRALGDGCTGTPFIQIYGPDGKLMISDRCRGKPGRFALEALRQWMAGESA